ncbi:MAG: GntR family transcriptional regulator [Beutenbergiaceae bacterium]
MESAPKPLGTLRKESLRDRALSALRDAITVGTLKPGQHLVETQLSSDLGISRGTFREAIRQLQQEGLVVEDARGRAHVPTITAELIRETFQVRASLESLAAVLIAARDDRAECVEILRDRLADLERAESGPVTSNIDADLAFHREICYQAENSMLLGSWESLAAIIRMSILHAGDRYARANMAAARHAPLLDAIDDGDISVIWNAFIAHNLGAAEVILGEKIPGSLLDTIPAEYRQY